MLQQNIKQFLIYFTLFLSSIINVYGDQKETKKNYLRLYPEFNVSLMRYGESQRSFSRYLGKGNFFEKNYYKFKVKVEKLYNHQKNNFRRNQEVKIPLIIHQIWLGSPLPEKYKEMMSSWQNWTGWTYMLWTDEDVKNLHLENQHLYDQATNYGERADILRLELLNQFGGMYVDIDFLCINSLFFDFTHQKYDFYIGLEPLECHPISCCNAIVGSSPGHPMIKALIENLESHVKSLPKISTVEERTGPRYVSKIIATHVKLLKKGIIFPPTFFYPLMRGEIESLETDRKRFIHPETAAVHFFEGNWRTEKGIIKKK